MTNALVTQEGHGQTAIVSPEEHSSATLMAMIQAVVDRGNDFDIEKIERLLSIQREMKADEAERVFNQQFALMQPELPVIDATGSGQYGKYGTFEDMQRQILPVLTRFGFSLQHKTRVEGQTVYTQCILRHNSGHMDISELPLPIDTSGNKAGIHAIASTKRYGKRYTTEDILCLQVIGDPNSSSTSQARQDAKQQRKSNMKPQHPPSDRQAELLMDMKATLNSCHGLQAIQEWDTDQRRAGNYEKLTDAQFNELKTLYDQRKGMFS